MDIVQQANGRGGCGGYNAVVVMKKLKWKLELSIAVSPIWVEDGFEASPKWITEFLRENLLPYSRPDELTISVKTIAAPEKSKIKKLQGYEPS